MFFWNISVVPEFEFIGSKEVHGQTGDAAHSPDIPHPLEFQVMDGHDRADPPVEGVSLEFIS